MQFDTDILIWIFRGDEAAANVVEEEPERFISVVTYMELVQGSVNNRETKIIKSFLRDLSFGVVPLSENIGHRASIYMEEYGAASGLRVADALIAATAVENSSALCTGDARHFRAIRELRLSLFQHR